MITKQPTIEDIYNFDAFITTPGVRDGLLERANSGDPELVTHETDDGPVVYYNAPHGEEIAVGRPIQLAEVGATKMGDYGYSGERQATMTDYDPTVRERLAQFLQAGFERFGMDRYKARQNAQTLMGGPSSNLPLQTGIADIVPFLGTALQTQEAARLGGESVESAKRGEYGTAAVQAGFAGLGMIPGAAGTVQASKALAPTAGKMAMDVAEKTGMPVRGLGIVEPNASAAGKATAPVSDTGFYSAVEQAALNIQRKSGTGQAFLNDITKGENVKADEVKWIGLDDFLKGKKNVTREEVQNFIAQNKVDIQEVTLGEQPGSINRNSKYATPEVIRIVTQNQGSADNAALLALDNSFDAYKEITSKFPELKDNPDWAETVLNDVTGTTGNVAGLPKFSQYTLPGGENYREILLTLPSKPQELPDGFTVNSYSVNGQTRYGVYDANGQRYGSGETKEQAIQRYSELHQNQQYKSSHWEQPNVLAHIRVNDRVDADGKKMLLVEEVQSDWHQAGRDKGYRTNETAELPQGTKVFAPGAPDSPGQTNMAYTVQIPRNVNGRSLFYGTTEEEAIANARSFIAQPSQSAVPDAPMKDTWYQLALKRVLKYAADNGYDRIGLTTGSRQAERYDLSKQVDELLYKKNADGTYRLSAQTGSRGNLLGDAIPEDKLSDYVGKEISKSIVEGSGKTVNLGGPGTVSQPKDEWKSMSGIDLQVGGEGMKKYYDEVYPQFLQKYGKKWGAKVGETTIPTERGDVGGVPSRYPQQEPVRFVDITPEMRESVGKGQPLFTATGVGAGTAGATMQDKEKK